MSTYELWIKIIKSRLYTKEVALKRVSVMGPNFTDTEFEALVDAVNETYPNEAV